MNIRKRYIILIILSILPFYKIIHFDDYCMTNVDYVVITFLSIIVFIAFIIILFFNLYQISVKKELFNFRPILIFSVFSIALYIGLKYPEIFLMKIPNKQFVHQIDENTTAKISLYKNKSFIFKTKNSGEFCTKYGSYFLRNDSLFLELYKYADTLKVMDKVYAYDSIQKRLLATSPNYPNFIEN